MPNDTLQHGAPGRPDTAAPGQLGTSSETLGLARAFGALLALTWGLIVLGALVRAHGAGLACPDWPLCFGEVVPEFDLKVAFEWGHRTAAGSISLLFAACAVLVLRRPTARRACGPWLAIAAALLATQVLLGALTVWELLASWTVTSHLVTGNAFASSLLVLALRLRDADRPAAARGPAVGSGFRAGVCLAGGLLALQMVLGGLVASRFVGLACPEWPTCSEGLWVPSWDGAVGLHVLHRFNGYALVAALAALALGARGVAGLGGWLTLGFGLGLAQVGVGVANVLLRIPVEVTGLHSALAAALIFTLVRALYEVWTRR